MFGGDGLDRLAVRTYAELGEEIAFGDPSVTDEERAAAGRETLAERSRVLLAENRRRAGERYAAGVEAVAGDATRVWVPRDPAALRSRLGQGELAVWAEHDILHVLWRGHADRVSLGGGVQPVLWPVQGTDDLWEASLLIRRLDDAVISIVVVAEHNGAVPLGSAATATATALWRGPRAPDPLPVAATLAGTIEERVIDSAALGASRAVTVYRPPNHQGRLPVCVLADGQSVPGFAGVLEPAVLSGVAPAVLLVGVHCATDPGRAGVDGRAREYLPGHNRRRVPRSPAIRYRRSDPVAERPADTTHRGLRWRPDAPTLRRGRSPPPRNAVPTYSPRWPR